MPQHGTFLAGGHADVTKQIVVGRDPGRRIEHILTDAFPATMGLASAGGGDSSIETDVALPSPCIAPIVFVTSGTGSWFASTGN